jgi:isopenicillin-N epimerase
MAAHSFKHLWHLSPDIAFLNHGSFGACPIAVLEHQQSIRLELERQPLQFMHREIGERIDGARLHLAQFLHAQPANLVFVPNATTGVNAVLRSLRFRPGDAVLTTNQEYNACRNALDFVAERTGINIIVANIPYPITDPQIATDAIIDALTPNTKLVLLDHVVSQTGFVLPIKEITHILNQRGIDTLIDGAHAPGMIPLDLDALGATYYTGNLHKWVCAPKGAAFLYVHSDRHASIHPTTISHGRNDQRTTRSRFHLEFDWTGTWDPSAYLSVPKAIEFMSALLPGGWAELMPYNRSKVLAARRMLSEKLKLPLPCPDSMVGSLATLRLPAAKILPLSHADLNRRLWQQYQIEVPIMPFPDASGYLVRISAQIYNEPAEYERLSAALHSFLH